MKLLLRNLLFAALTAALFSGSSFNAGDNPPYRNKNIPLEERIEDLLSRMTLEEKIDLLGGTGFASKPNERLGIPELKMSDGPVGVRWGKATSFPSGIAMAASWDTALIYEYGQALAGETKAKGRDVILGPCVNIARIPQGGRNFESFGEDPYLTSRLAVNYIKGVQSQNVAATVKHFAVNNQEHQRNFVDVVVDERTLNEIYFPAFKAAVEEAGVLAVMSAYNKVNGSYASENNYLLMQKLKNEWNFNGLVMSDWGAVHSSLPTALNGLDLEMPDGKYLNNDSLSAAVKSGTLDQSIIDDKVRRILRVIFNLGLFDNPASADSSLSNTSSNRAVAYSMAAEGMVLLQNNDNLLPLNLKSVRTIAVVGPSAAEVRTGGGGSSLVDPVYSVTPLEALKERLGSSVKLLYAEGVKLDGDVSPIPAEYFPKMVSAEYFDNKALSGTPVKVMEYSNLNLNWGHFPPFDGFKNDNYSVRFNAELKPEISGIYNIDVASDDGVRLYIDDKLVIDDWNDHGVSTNSYETPLDSSRVYKIKLEYYENGGEAVVKLGWRKPDDDIMNSAVQIARKADAVLFFGGTSANIESEGRDRDNLELPNNQDLLISKIAEVNSNVAVILTAGSPLLMDKWLHKVDAVLFTWFAGAETGNAAADILLGKVNPSGKLPVTFPQKWEQSSAFHSYMKKDSIAEYNDSIWVGYRHFERNDIKPLFPFGFGLSYTSFSYSGLKITPSSDGVIVEFSVKNTGTVTGTEISQLYVGDPAASVLRPLKELKRFSRISLKPGEQQKVSFTLTAADFSYYDISSHGWKFEPGKFIISIGASSADIKLKGEINL